MPVKSVYKTISPVCGTSAETVGRVSYLSLIHILKQEDAISSLDGVDTVQSFSQENVAVVLVQYKYGTNIDTAYINLKKAIDGIRSQMPDDIEEPNILEMDMNAQPVVTLAVSGQVDENLYTYVDNNIVPQFEKLGSVGEVSLSGGQESYIRVELIPEKMAQYLSLIHIYRNAKCAAKSAEDPEYFLKRRH